jgi:SAM-dependent methyltransferase
MHVKDLRQDWDAHARSDPMWAILTDPSKQGNRWEAAEFFQTGVQEIAQVLEYLRALGLAAPTRRALDFGCGVGRLTQALAAHYDEVHGVDVAPQMIELARRYNRYADSCEYHANDSASLPLFASDYFDLIYSNITLQHNDPRDSTRYIQEFVRVLAPGGVLIFQLPSAPRNSLKAHFKHAAAGGLLWLFRRTGYIKRPIMVMHAVPHAAVIALLEKAGATVVDVRSDDSAGEDWRSYRYCATKPGSRPVARGIA